MGGQFIDNLVRQALEEGEVRFRIEWIDTRWASMPSKLGRAQKAGLEVIYDGEDFDLPWGFVTLRRR